jgi:hypothetical protein
MKTKCLYCGTPQELACYCAQCGAPLYYGSCVITFTEPVSDNAFEKIKHKIPLKNIIKTALFLRGD